MLKEDLNKIKSSGKCFVFADKTTNFYEMPLAQYKRLLNNNIPKMYCKVDSNAK